MSSNNTALASEYHNLAKAEMVRLFGDTCLEIACALLLMAAYYTLEEGGQSKTTYYFQLIEKQVEMLGINNTAYHCKFLQSMVSLASEQEKPALLAKLQQASSGKKKKTHNKKHKKCRHHQRAFRKRRKPSTKL